MLNDITNELSTYRAEKLLAFDDQTVTDKVIDAMNRISPGAIMGLQGVSAGDDGITRQAWDQAVSSAESVAATVYGYKAVENQYLSDVEAVTFEDAVAYVADRVAESILTLHGYETVKPRRGPLYVVVTTNKYGYVSGVKVMDAKPSFDAQDEVDGCRIDVYVASINGGDSSKYDWR